jgi:cardiolipin synthase C
MLSRFFLLLLFILSSFSSFGNTRGLIVNLNQKLKVLPLHDGPYAFIKRIDLIRSAKFSIELEYFIFNDDLSGKIIIDELIKAARKGVRVRLLLDALMVKGKLTPFHIHQIKKHNIEIRYYNDIALIRAINTQYRDHRKLFIVDREHLIIGGRNIANEYFDLDERYNFLDRDIYVHGNIGRKSRELFDLFWKSVPSQNVLRDPKPNLDMLHLMSSAGSARSRILKKYRSELHTWKMKVKKAKKFLKPHPLVRKTLKSLKEKVRPKFIEFAEKNNLFCKNPMIVSDPPLVGPSNDNKRKLRKAIYLQLESAKKKITIDSPYFILTHGSDGMMKDILKKGVDVELLTNGIYSTDALPVASVFNFYLDDWIEAGLKPTVFGGKRSEDITYVLERAKPTRWGTHSKSIVFDDDSVMIGTFNFDPRSAFYSAEISLFCSDSKELAMDTRKNIYKRMAGGKKIETKEDAKRYRFENVSTMKKMGYYLISPLALLLQRLL